MRCLHRARCTRSGQLNTPTREGCGARSCSARATVMHTGWELPSSGGPRTQGTAAGREAGGGCAPMGRKPWAPGSCSCSKWGELATRGVVLISPQSPSRTGPRVGPSRRAPMSQAPRSGLGDMGHGNCLSSRPACPQPLWVTLRGTGGELAMDPRPAAHRASRGGPGEPHLLPRHMFRMQTPRPCEATPPSRVPLPDWWGSPSVIGHPGPESLTWGWRPPTPAPPSSRNL